MTGDAVLEVMVPDSASGHVSRMPLIARTITSQYLRRTGASMRSAADMRVGRDEGSPRPTRMELCCPGWFTSGTSALAACQRLQPDG